MRIFRAVLAGIAFSAGLAMAPAQPLEPLSDDALDEVRGGFSVGGIEIASIGVKLETLVDSIPVLTSTLNITAAGAVSDFVADNVAGAVSLAEATDSDVNGATIHGQGLVLEGNGGVTTLIQDLSDTSIRNMILNTANDRNFVQNTFVTIVMPNLHELQQGMSTQQLGSNLGQALNFGLLGSAY